MSEQENTRPSLRGIESVRSQITGKHKGGQEEEDENMAKAEKIDAVDEFFSRLGVGDTDGGDTGHEDESPREETGSIRNVRDIFADLTAEDRPGDEDSSGDILRPEISYQDISSEEQKEDDPGDIYTRDDGSEGDGEDAEKAQETEENDPFLQKMQAAAAPAVKARPGSKIAYASSSGGELLSVQEKNGIVAVSFEKDGKNIVTLRMPALSIPEGHPVSASLAPGISLSLSCAKGRRDVLNAVLDNGGERVKAEIVSGAPRKISFGAMEFDVFAGTEVDACGFSITVEEDRLLYRY